MIHMTSGYSLATYGARVALEKSLPMLEAAVDDLPEAPTQIVDYGIADGGTALSFWQGILRRIRDRHSHPLTFVGNDLPENPHHELALNLNRLQQTTLGLQVFIAPVSFYQAVVSTGSTQLGFSATAMHWLSRVPGPLHSHIHANSADAAERHPFRDQALLDFEQLLLRRAEEMSPGAHLILVNLAEAEDGQSLGKNHRDRSMFDDMRDIFAETLTEHRLPEQILTDTVFQNYYKRRADFEEVLAKPALDQTFRILDHRIVHTPCPYRARYEETEDTVAFGQGLMQTMRSWSRHTFLAALRQHGADPQVADTFYERLQRVFQAAPDRYSMDYVHSFLHLQKN